MKPELDSREALIFSNGVENGALEEELRLAAEAGVRIVTLLDPEYPALLRTMPSPPPVLYVKGTLLQEDEAAVAMVGTRAATPYGLGVAKRYAHELVRCGITVVSGLAEGIDGAAHEGALAAGGRTIAVLGHGLNHLFPSIHRKLAGRVAASGALISEFPMGMPPLKQNFPRRNRLIAGLSLGVVVVEAPVRSGALITAREAAELGRDVFAVPGPVTSEASRGCHRLIQDGAKLVEGVVDLLEEIAPRLKDQLRGWRESSAQADGENSPGVLQALSQEERLVYGAIPAGRTAMVDTLSGATMLDPSKLLPLLTGLELKGFIKQIPGKGFSR